MIKFEFNFPNLNYDRGKRVSYSYYNKNVGEL